MNSAHPYLNFMGNTEEAFTFYRSVFGGAFLGVLRYRGFAANPMQVPEAELDKIAHIALPLGKHNILMGTDALACSGRPLTVGNNFSINLEPESGEEAERLFAGLAAGGQIQMPLQASEWAEKYGMLTDKFGVQWIVNFTGKVQSAGCNAEPTR